MASTELVQVVSSSGTVPVSPDSIETLLALNATELNDWLNSMTQVKFNAFCTTLLAAGCVSAPVRLAWKDLTVTENGITLLDKVCGIIEPGETVCVLGAPDSGATLLLDVLSERYKPTPADSVSGSILWNGDANLDPYRRSLGYVPIGDEHMPQLSVWETMEFSAMLRCSTKAPPALKRIMVRVMLAALSLTAVTDSVVGSGELRGISGGERRRLSLALEMVTLPSVLFAHQPTNGLDSANALLAAQYLKTMAKAAQRSLITTLVQPSPELLLQFDKVLLVSKGAVLYFGPSAGVLTHFFSLGYRLPKFKSWTEFLEEISGQPDLFFEPAAPFVDGLKLDGLSVDLKALPTLLPKDQAAPTTTVDIWTYSNKAYQAGADNLNLVGRLTDTTVPAIAPPVPDEVSIGTQLYWIMVRQWLFLKGTPAMTFGRIVPSAVFALILGSLFYQIGNDQANARTRTGAIFFVIANTAFSAFPLVNQLFAIRPVYYIQKRGQYFRPTLFPIAFMIFDLPLSMLSTFVFTVILYPMIGLMNGVNSLNYFYFWFMAVLLGQTARSWVFFLGSALPVEDAASVVAPVTTVVQFLFAGYIMPRYSIPIGWRWFHFSSFFTYAFRGLMINEFKDRPLTCSFSQLVPSTYNPLLSMAAPIGFGNAQVCPYLSGEAYCDASYDIDTNESMWSSVGYICIFLSVFTMLALRALANIDHSKLASRLPPLFRDVMTRTSTDTAASSEVAVGKAAKPLTVYLSFTDLCYSVMVPPPTVDGHATAGPDVEKKILTNVFGTAGPGNMVALMGASGAGKTTLLDVLAGRKTGGSMTGNITINGKPKDTNFFHRYAAYVEQFDSHLPQATVREAVAFSAAMRLESSVSDEERMRRVDDVLTTLELQRVADVQIGLPATGGLSAELRKKVSIAAELISNPGILFLDEPTTGLDASAALSVMLAVRKLANDISVVCTIHQPSSTVLALFDSLLLLEPGGKVAFYGPMLELPQYFAEVGLGQCPADQNIADFALKVLQQRAKAGSDATNTGSALFASHARYQGLLADVARINAPPKDASELSFDTVMTASIGTMFRENMRRSMQSLFRNIPFRMARIMSALSFAVVLGTLDYQMGNDIRDASNRISIMFFSLTTPVFSSLAAIPVVQSKRVLLARERATQMYHSSIFFLTEWMADWPLTVIQAFVYSIPVYFFAGFRTDDASRYWIFWATIFCLYMTGISGANFVGYLAETAAGANLIMTSFLSMNILFVGFIISLPLIPAGWVWAHYLNVFRYPLFTMVPNELQQMDFQCITSGLIWVPLQPTNPACGTVANAALPLCWKSTCPSGSAGGVHAGDVILSIFNMPAADIPWNGAVMLAVIVILRILGLLSFKFINHVNK